MFGRHLRRDIQRLQEAQKERQGAKADSTDQPLLSFYVRVTARLLGAERCSIFILDRSTKKVWLKRGTGVDDRAIEVDVEGSIVGRVIGSGQPTVESRLESKEGAHKSVQADLGFVTRNLICVPIRTVDGRAVVGAVQVLNKRDGDFSAEDLETLAELAHYLQMAIESIYYDQEIVGTMARVARFSSVALAVVALSIVALSVFMILYVVAVVAVGD